MDGQEDRGNFTLTGQEAMAIAEHVVSLMEKRGACLMSKADQDTLGHMLGMLRDVGDNSLPQGGACRGVEVFRSLGLRFTRTDKIAQYVTRGIVWAVVSSVGVGVLYLFYCGCKAAAVQFLDSLPKLK